MKRLAMVLMFSCVAGSVSAQRKIVFPPGMGSKPGTESGPSYVFPNMTKPAMARAVQAIFRTGPKDGGKVTAMSLRPMSKVAWGSPKFTVVMQLGFSTFSRRIADVSPFLSKNRGKDFVRVFKGTIAFPAVPYKLRKVSPFLFRIPFQKSFTMKASSTILWDLHVDSSSQYSNPQNWGMIIDAIWNWPSYPDPRYKVVRYGRSCPRAGADNMLFASRMAIGHRFFMDKGPVSPANTNTLGVLLIGASKAKWGPVKLPFSLGQLGAPGCSVYASPEVLMPAFLQRSLGMVTASSEVPRLTVLIGQSVYGQGFALNARNSLGVQSSNGVEWKIGPWFPLDYAHVWSDHHMNPSKVGIPYTSGIPIFQLEVQ